jgi:hypothetical protein
MTEYNESYIPDEKKWFTVQRSIFLRRQSSVNRDKILELEKQFGEFCFTPLDIPKITDENFYNWYFENATPVVKQNKDVTSDATGHSTFLSINILPDRYDTSKSIWSKNIIKDFDKLWPNLWQQFNDYFPFQNINEISIWSSTKDVVGHRDHSLFLDLPTEFRVLMDPNPNVNLSITEVLPNTPLSEGLGTADVPIKLESNSFAWNNLRCQHHSKFYPEYKKIIFIFNMSNKIDWNRYEQLITRSVKHWNQYTLKSTRDISSYIDDKNINLV